MRTAILTLLFLAPCLVFGAERDSSPEAGAVVIEPSEGQIEP